MWSLAAITCLTTAVYVSHAGGLPSLHPVTSTLARSDTRAAEQWYETLTQVAREWSGRTQLPAQLPAWHTADTALTDAQTFAPLQVIDLSLQPRPAMPGQHLLSLPPPLA